MFFISFGKKAKRPFTPAKERRVNAIRVAQLKRLKVEFVKTRQGKKLAKALISAGRKRERLLAKIAKKKEVSVRLEIKNDKRNFELAQAAWRFSKGLRGFASKQKGIYPSTHEELRLQELDQGTPLRKVELAWRRKGVPDREIYRKLWNFPKKYWF